MRNCHYNSLSTRAAMKGFSLVEIMVALGISLFILAGIGYVYTNSKQTYRVQDQLSRLQENGRLAFEYLTRDIRMAGYWGCGTSGMDSDIQYIPPTPPGKCDAPPRGRVTNTLTDAATSPYNFGRYIEGFENVNDTTTFAIYPNVQPKTDVVVLRGADSLGLRVTKHAGGTPPGSSDIKVNDASQIFEGDILMVTDCSTAGVFQATNVNNKSNVVHNTGNVGGSGDKIVPGNSTNDLCKNYEGGEVFKAFSRGYYIGKLDSANKPTSAGRPALFRANFSVSQELVPEVENMQITYGVDTNDDYFVDTYLAADQVNTANQWGKVKSVHIELLLVSTEDNITSGNVSYRFPTNASSDTVAKDRRLYYVTSTTISIRNRAQ